MSLQLLLLFVYFKPVGNVINPDDVVNEYGADTLRLYEMFMGPFEDTKPWSTKSIKGVRRFLDRSWSAMQQPAGIKTTPDLQKTLHKTIKKVTNDIEQFKFNTAISQLMICLNAISANPEFVDEQTQRSFLQLLSPFAPHLAAELAELQGYGQDLFASWPKFDETLTQDDSVQVAVQVSGKVRGTIELSPDADEASARLVAEANENVVKHITGKEIIKVIYVPGRIINLIVKG